MLGLPPLIRAPTMRLRRDRPEIITSLAWTLWEIGGAAVGGANLACLVAGDGVPLERICGEWHARGLNQYRQNEIETESFVFSAGPGGW